MLRFDVGTVPFSRYGSYIVFSRRQPQPPRPATGKRRRAAALQNGAGFPRLTYRTH